MEETHTSLRHVVGQDYQSYTPVTSIEIKIHKEADIGEMLQAYKSFLLATGYSPERVREYIPDE